MPKGIIRITPPAALGLPRPDASRFEHRRVLAPAGSSRIAGSTLMEKRETTDAESAEALESISTSLPATVLFVLFRKFSS
jgi:hypothetical protein